MPFASFPGVRVPPNPDANVVILVDDENNPIIWAESEDSGGILLD